MRKVNQVDQINQEYLQKAVQIALKSKCQRAKNGAVLVKDGRILVQAYNQIFPENDFCQKKGCLRDKLKLGLGKEAEKCRSIHAEAKAVTLAAKKGLTLVNSIAYITVQPCINCAKLFYNSGIKKVYYVDRHADQTGNLFLEKMGISCLPGIIKNKKIHLRLRDISFQKND